MTTRWSASPRSARNGDKLARLFDHGDTGEYPTDRAAPPLRLLRRRPHVLDTRQLDRLLRIIARSPRWDRKWDTTGRLHIGEDHQPRPHRQDPRGYTSHPPRRSPPSHHLQERAQSGHPHLRTPNPSTADPLVVP